MKITDIFKKIFDIQEGQCVGSRIVGVDDTTSQIRIRKEYVFNNKVIIFEECVDFPETNYGLMN